MDDVVYGCLLEYFGTALRVRERQAEGEPDEKIEAPTGYSSW
jgi:hypothetical protein